MYLIRGVDGCSGGWVVISQDLDSGAISWRLCSKADELARAKPAPRIIALDIPIGLPERGPRACDLEARQLLGRGRASSVFPAPIRPVLDANCYDRACQIRFRIEGKKMSRQAWNILPKIRDVDQLLRRDSELAARVREIHPEICFYTMAGGRPMQHNKKTLSGHEERRKLLEPWFGEWVQAVLAERDRGKIAEDDVLDAFAALWTAGRIAAGTAAAIPSAPPRDAFGLRMQIVA